jgi:hypothetical protein
MLVAMEATPPPRDQGPRPLAGPQASPRHRPRERYVRDAMHRLEDHGAHHFAVPVVTPQSAPPPQPSSDW